jgi:hypothetical protein
LTDLFHCRTLVPAGPKITSKSRVAIKDCEVRDDEAPPSVDVTLSDTWQIYEIGHCADNAACESFFGLLKRERVNHRRYRPRDEARADLFDYLERFHNPRMRRRVARRDEEFSALIKPSVETR